MHREYITTFLGITTDDIKDFVTLRRRFDELNNHKNEVKVPEEKNIKLIKEKQSELFNPTDDQPKKLIPFPYQSFLNIRHWHKPPKSLKIFFQALSCLFSLTKHDFLTELKSNHKLLLQNQPSAPAINEFRIKYFHLNEISLEYIRKISLDAYLIAI